MKSVPFSFICFLSRNLTSAFLSLFCPLKPMCCRVLFVPAVTQPPRCGATKVKVTPSGLCIPMREQPSFLVSHLFAFDSEGQNKSSGPDHNGADFHAFFFFPSVHICDKLRGYKLRIKWQHLVFQQPATAHLFKFASRACGKIVAFKYCTSDLADLALFWQPASAPQRCLCLCL